MFKNKNQFTCPLLPPKHPRVSISVMYRCKWLRLTNIRQTRLVSHHWRLTKRSNFEEGMLWKFGYWLQVKMKANLTTAFKGKKYWGPRIKLLVVEGSQWRDFHWDKGTISFATMWRMKEKSGWGWGGLEDGKRINRLLQQYEEFRW